MAAVAPAADTFRVTTTTAPDYVTRTAADLKTAQLKFAAATQAAFAFDSNFDSPQPTADVHEERPLSRSSVCPLVRDAALLGAGVHTGPLLLQFSNTDPMLVEKARLPWNAH